MADLRLSGMGCRRCTVLVHRIHTIPSNFVCEGALVTSQIVKDLQSCVMFCYAWGSAACDVGESGASTSMRMR